MPTYSPKVNAKIAEIKNTCADYGDGCCIPIGKNEIERCPYSRITFCIVTDKNDLSPDCKGWNPLECDEIAGLICDEDIEQYPDMGA